tara:strand:- start:370 stop:573 length:204 start_codon:yes stop_codon:yes gene_type:complete
MGIELINLKINNRNMDFLIENIFFVLVITIGMYVLFKLPQQIRFFVTKDKIDNEKLKKRELIEILKP